MKPLRGTSVTFHLSFLRGAFSCEELFARAADLGIAGGRRPQQSRGHRACPRGFKGTGVRLIVGCRLDLVDGMSVLVYPTDRPAYSRLCRLLSVGK